jgi:hypothetical protein
MANTVPQPGFPKHAIAGGFSLSGKQQCCLRETKIERVLSNMAATRPHGVTHQAKFLQINPPKDENAKDGRYNHQFDGDHLAPRAGQRIAPSQDNTWNGATDVRVGSLADILSGFRHVRFTPDSRHR